MAKEVFRLKQTESKWVFVGQVSRMGAKGAFRSGLTKNQDEYRSCRFSIKTSETNENTVELFGQVNKLVYPFSSAKKKESGEGTLKWPWAKRKELPEGYHLIGKNLGLVKNGDEVEKVSLVEYDAVAYIKENLHDGDWVWATGDVVFDVYTNTKTNEVKPQTKYTINALFKIDSKNFKAEDFAETSSFMQQFVYVESEHDKELKKVLVDGYTIQYKDKFSKTVGLVVNEETHPKMAQKMKNLKFGDYLQVLGTVSNGVTLEDAEDDDTPDEWGSTKPQGFDNKGVKTYISELVITAVEEYTEKLYTEDDFKVSEAEKAFGKQEKKNPFADDNDDVPFKD